MYRLFSTQNVATKVSLNGTQTMKFVNTAVSVIKRATNKKLFDTSVEKNVTLTPIEKEVVKGFENNGVEEVITRLNNRK